MEVEYFGGGVLIFSYLILINQRDTFGGLYDNQVEPRQLDTSEFIGCRFDGPPIAARYIWQTLPNVKGPLDDAALGKHFSIMHHRYSQSSMLLKHTANSSILDRCCMLQQHATRHCKVSYLRALVECWYCYNDWLYQEKLSRFWL